MGTFPRSVTLIIPPSVFLLDERVFLSLGVLKVAAALEAQGVTVELLDLSGIANYVDAVRDHISITSSQHVGMTTTTPQLPAARRVIEVIRETRPDIRIILGGPHPTLVVAAQKREAKRGVYNRAHAALKVLEGLTDIVVAGDGERAIFEAIQYGAARLIDADDRQSPLWIPETVLTELPFPARHLVDMDSYRYTIDGAHATSIIAQLGCPFQCGFCGGRFSPMLRHIRTREAVSIVRELVHLYETYGFEGFMFYDDELNVNRQVVELMHSIADAQAKLGVSWRLRGFIKAELFTETQAAAMHGAGFQWILVGFESGAPRILANMNKRATREQNTRCVEIAARHGLKVKALMSLGHPGESAETIHETEKWLLAVTPQDFDATIITTYPGTPYYDDALPHETRQNEWVYTCPSSGDRLYSIDVDFSRVAEYYKGNPDDPDGYRAYVYTDALSRDDLREARDSLERGIRKKLGIPFNPARPAVLYEHSMGQHGALPAYILRKTTAV